MKTKILTTAVVALLAISCVPAVSAQGININFGKHRRNKHVGIGINIPLGGHHRHVHSECCRQWVQGRTEVIHEQVFVPGCARQVWVAPQYRTEWDACGNAIQILVRPGYYETVQDGGHYEVRPRTITHPGHWAYVCGH